MWESQLGNYDTAQAKDSASLKKEQEKIKDTKESAPGAKFQGAEDSHQCRREEQRGSWGPAGTPLPRRAGLGDETLGGQGLPARDAPGSMDRRCPHEHKAPATAIHSPGSRGK